MILRNFARLFEVSIAENLQNNTERKKTSNL